MSTERLYARYQELQSYVGWSEEDRRLVVQVAPQLAPHLSPLIDDFYAEIDRHPEARKVITGGTEQVERLKGTLLRWIAELLSGRYDSEYVARRWRVGWRHVEIGLAQVYTNMALSRLRTGLVRSTQQAWDGDPIELQATTRALNKLLDLDLAIIEDAYQAEYMARLQRTERLATLGQVAGGIAHELRQPLNVVKTSVYYLRNARNSTPEKRAEHLQRIERSVDLADGVIKALSGFARMPSPELRAVALHAAVREALEINPPGERVEVAVDCPADLPAAMVDRDQLQIVLGNLIRNARDAMPDGGQLGIEARSLDNVVEIAVVDSGIGIAPEALARVAEPLYSTKARGLGLGLAIVQSVLERNRGSLHVASEPGRGSRFTVRLEAAPGAAGGAA